MVATNSAANEVLRFKLANVFAAARDNYEHPSQPDRCLHAFRPEVELHCHADVLTLLHWQSRDLPVPLTADTLDRNPNQSFKSPVARTSTNIEFAAHFGCFDRQAMLVSGGAYRVHGFDRRIGGNTTAAAHDPDRVCESSATDCISAEKIQMSLDKIPIDISEVADELEFGDESFSIYDLQELKAIALFKGMKPGPEKVPGSMILRRCKNGRVLCRQGERGATAFQILTTEDALNVRRAQLRAFSAEEAAIAEPLNEQNREQVFDPELADDNRIQILQQRKERFLQGRNARVEVLESEIQRLERIQMSVGRQMAGPPRVVATARLIVAPESDKRRKGLLHRLMEKLRGRRSAVRSEQSTVPEYIPNDGPQDLNINTLSAPMYEGDLFGEMSCMNLAPRSATVIVSAGHDDEPVYMIEMVRSALDARRGDAVYRKRMDETYRARVMEMQVRSLPLFQVLTNEEYNWLAAKLELVEFRAGAIIFDEHDSAADCCYVIRSGVVKVARSLGCLLGREEVQDFTVMCRELATCSIRAPGGSQFWKELSDESRELILRIAEAESPPDNVQRAALRHAINKWIQTSSIHKSFGQQTADVIEKAELAQYAALFQDFQEEATDWWGLEVRIFNRVLVENFCPNGIRKRASVLSNRLTLAYHSRGEIIGEIALMRGEDRSATCLAFTHPLSGQKTATQANLIPQRVEAVRISAAVLHELIEKSAKFKLRVNEILSKRIENDQRVEKSAAGRRSAIQTTEFEELGLAWGQSLMVIDLDRCTRCQECVKACVNSHDDGRTRLYLDGPRFESKYLIPMTCRKCLDPVCMIGCPVGAINRGMNGEIRISNHCIGCSKCADQCPYGSIQMDFVDTTPQLTSSFMELLGLGNALDPLLEKAVVCDLCSSTPSRDPACVYACPHDAAIRVHGLRHFNQ